MPEDQTPEQQKRDKKRENLQRWREANREKTRAWDRQNSAKNKEKIQKKNKKQYERLKALGVKRRKSQKKRNRANEKERQWCRAWRAKNREKVTAYNAVYMPKWAAENVDRMRQYHIDHAEENKARARLRTARKKGSGGTHTQRDIAEIFKLQQGKCAYFSKCHTEIAKSGNGKYHIDHIEPLAPKAPGRLPGSSNPSNLQLLCAPCNMRKRNHDPYKFTQQHEGRLFPDLPRDPQAPAKKKVN